MNIAKIKGFRILGLTAAVALVGGIAVWADSGTSPGSAPTATAPATTTANKTVTEEAAPCGCGGPKSYYLKKYGTIKPPAFQTQTEGQPQTPSQNTGSVNPSSTGNGG